MLSKKNPVLSEYIYMCMNYVRLSFRQGMYEWTMNNVSVTVSTTNGSISDEKFELQLPKEYDAISAPVQYSYACAKAPALSSNQSQEKAVELVFINVQVRGVGGVCVVVKLWTTKDGINCSFLMYRRFTKFRIAITNNFVVIIVFHFYQIVLLGCFF